MTSEIRVAIVHDDLIQFGGAEKVFMALLDLYPSASVYTSVISTEWKDILQKKKINVSTSFMQSLINAVSWNRFYSTFLFHLIAFERFDLSSFDLVISSSSRFAHGVITKPDTKHICYMHSPGRMFWEQSKYFENEKLSKNIFGRIVYTLGSFPLSFMRLWDYAASQRVDMFVSNSIGVHNKITRFYQRDSSVIYPFCDVSYFTEQASEETGSKGEYGEFYLVLSRLISWKKIEIAIEACKKTNNKLIIAGDGPDRKRLEKLAGSNCTFLGFVDEPQKKKLLRDAKALILTQEEDFGLTSLEAMASGTPVIAYGLGGALETVVPGNTGEFFSPQTSAALALILEKFSRDTYKSEVSLARAKEFDKTVFLGKMKALIESFYVPKN
ncbi:MAG: glycosyltransferase [Patescibacteria group bacterium]